MAVIEVNGRRVEVGDEFRTMTPEQQGAMVDDIASQIGAAPVTRPEQAVAKPVAAGGMLDLMNQPSRMPNSVADTLVPQTQDQIGADFSQFFKANPADTSAIPAQTPEQAVADEAALRNDIRVSQNPDISSDYLLQELAKAPGDVVGMPQDLGTLLGNLGLMAADTVANRAGKVFGNDDMGVDYRIPYDLPGSSDYLNKGVQEGLRSNANTVLNLMGEQPLQDNELRPIAPEDVSPQDRVLGAGTRFAAGGGLGGGWLAGGKQSASWLGKLLPNAAPYADDAGKALLGDVAAGFGSGVAQQTYDDRLSPLVTEKLGDKANTVASVLSAILGGTTGASVNAAGHTVANSVENLIKDKTPLSPLFLDERVPVNPDTGQKYRPSEVDMAARFAQSLPTDRAKTVANIRRSKDDFAFADPSQQPDVGMRADDVGMAMAANAARSKDPARFKNQDNRREALATTKLGTLAPADAEGRDMTNKATELYRSELSAADQKVQQSRAELDAGGEDVVKQNLELTEAKNRQNQSSAALDSDFRAQNDAAMAEKNAKYAETPRDAPIEAKPLYEELMAIEESVPRAARVGTEYATAAKRIRDLISETDPDTGNVKLRDLTYGDANVIRKEISAARKEAVKAGRDVTDLDRLGATLGARIKELNPEADRYFAEEFSPRCRTGRAGEYANSLKSAVRTNEESSATRPSDFGDKFLKKPEDAASLQRAIDVNGKPVTAENATQWMMGDLAKSGVTNAKGIPRYDKVVQWAAKNKDVIDQFPAMRARIDTEIERARKGGQFSKDLADKVKAAETEFADTKTTLEQSALQSAIGKDPRRAVADIMENSGDPETQMADMVKRLKASGDDKAVAGLKAATRDWIKHKVKTTAHLVGQDGARKTSRASLDNIFTEHEKTLAKVYSPEEMNTLRQAHKLLDVAANLDVQARPGSDTADKMRDLTSFFSANSEKRKANMRMFEVAAKLKYGMLKGGGITRTMGLVLDSMANLSTKPQAVENLIMEMMLNPDLADMLLMKNVKAVGTPAWNSKLNKYLSAASGARDDKIEEDK